MKRLNSISLLLLIGIFLFISPAYAFEKTVVRFDNRYGDVDENKEINLTDAVVLLGYLFKGTSLSPKGLEQADTNNDGKVDISDAVTTLYYLFWTDQLPINSRVGQLTPIKPEQLLPGIFGSAVIIFNKDEGTLSYGQLGPSDELSFDIIPDTSNELQLAIGYNIYIKDTLTNTKNLDLSTEDNRDLLLQPQDLIDVPSASADYQSTYALDQAQKQAIKQYQNELNLKRKKELIDSNTPNLIEEKLRSLLTKGVIKGFQQIIDTQLEEDPAQSTNYNIVYEVSLPTPVDGQDLFQISIPKQMNHKLAGFISNLDAMIQKQEITGYDLQENGPLFTATLIGKSTPGPDKAYLDMLDRPTQAAMTDLLQDYIQQLTTALRNYHLTLVTKIENGFTDYRFFSENALKEDSSLLNYLNNQYSSKKAELKAIPDGQGAAADQDARFRMVTSDYFTGFQIDNGALDYARILRAQIHLLLTSVSYNPSFLYGRINSPDAFPLFLDLYEEHEGGLALLATYGKPGGEGVETGWFTIGKDEKDPEIGEKFFRQHVEFMKAKGIWIRSKIWQDTLTYRWYKRAYMFQMTPFVFDKDIVIYGGTYGDLIQFKLNAAAKIYPSGYYSSFYGAILLFKNIIKSMTGQQGTDSSLSLKESFDYAKKVASFGFPYTLLEKETESFVLYPTILNEEMEKNGWPGGDFDGLITFSVEMDKNEDITHALEVDFDGSNITSASINNVEWSTTNDHTVGFNLIIDDHLDLNTKYWVKIMLNAQRFKPKLTIDSSIKLHGNEKWEDGLPDKGGGHWGQRPTSHGQYEDGYFYYVIKKTANGLKVKLCHDICEPDPK